MRRPLSTRPVPSKNAEHVRDPEMYQTKKGNEWRFGMKIHVGVDAGTGAVISVEVTAANVHDVAGARKLLQEDDVVVYGDSGYLGIENVPKSQKMSVCPRLNTASTAAPASCIA